MKISTRQCRIGLLAVLLTTAVASLVHAGDATTIRIPPAADNTLYERATGDVSNGAGPSLFIGQTGANANNALRRALLRFDLSGIPPGSQVVEARLEFSVDLVPPSPTGFDARLHRMLSDWGEAGSFAPGAGGGGALAQSGDATWLHRFFDTDLWTDPGGDFDPAASAVAPVGSATGPVAFESTPTLVGDVQTWVNQPASNFGWIMRGEEDNPQNARRIPSRENTALAPALEVTFIPALLPPAATPVPALGWFGLMLMVLVLGLAAARFAPGR